MFSAMKHIFYPKRVPYQTKFLLGRIFLNVYQNFVKVLRKLSCEFISLLYSIFIKLLEIFFKVLAAIVIVLFRKFNHETSLIMKQVVCYQFHYHFNTK